MDAGGDAEVGRQLREEGADATGREGDGKVGEPGGFAEAAALGDGRQAGGVGDGVGIGFDGQEEEDEGAQHGRRRHEKCGERFNLKDGAGQTGAEQEANRPGGAEAAEAGVEFGGVFGVIAQPAHDGWPEGGNRDAEPGHEQQQGRDVGGQAAGDNKTSGPGQADHRQATAADPVRQAAGDQDAEAVDAGPNCAERAKLGAGRAEFRRAPGHGKEDAGCAKVH